VGGRGELDNERFGLAMIYAPSEQLTVTSVIGLL